MTGYVTNCGPVDGPARKHELPSPIGVLDPDSSISGLPIGQAFAEGWDDTGVVRWRLVIGKAEVPGRFVLRCQRFEPIG